MKNSNSNIQAAYNEQYENSIVQWRKLSAKSKALNVIELIGNQTFPKVLEYGAGEGSILAFLDNFEGFKELYAVEISESGIRKIKEKNINKLKGVEKFDGYRTNFEDNAFDLLYCSHVIEHVEHPRLVLREIKRISKHQIFEIPLDYTKDLDKKVEYFLDYGHINIFTPSLFKFLLLSEGFKIENELYSVTGKEQRAYNWYQNRGLRKSLKRRIMMHLAIKKNLIIQFFLGEKVSKEFFHDTYTCLTIGKGSLKIF